MSEQSAKPYLVRALYEWCVEQGYTPFLAVRVSAKTKVPMEYVKNGEIILNVSPIATHKLTMDNEWTLFNARFNGVTQEIAVPFTAVVGIFAKETGYGMSFQPEAEAAPSESGVVELNGAPSEQHSGPELVSITGSASEMRLDEAETQSSVLPVPTPPVKPKPTLTVVK